MGHGPLGSAPLNTNIKTVNNMKFFETIGEKLLALIKKKAVEVLVAMLTAAITALTTTSCMGHGPLF